jgi:tetratricopeptide (TPR) repeat protein
MSNSLIEDLKGEIAARRCIAIVGAGVSISSTDNAPCASWTGLLHHGVQRCVDVVPNLPEGWAARSGADIDSGDIDDLLSGAEKVSRKLGAPLSGEYSRWLRESVGALHAVHREILEALKELGVVLATTNYDDLIEGVTGLPAVTWMDGARVERVLRGDEPAVVHLHGHWQRPESVILGIRSYEQVLGNEHAQAILRAMTTMQTILFVGCGEGLKDPNFAALCDWTGRVFAGSEYRRFRLARTGEVARLQKEHTPEQRLFVIGYGAGFAELAPFLRALRSAGKPSSSPAVKAVSPNFPACLPPRPRCFGRDEEIADLVAALLAPQPEPVPVLGPPGIGKTNLALAAAHDERVAARYGTRRIFIRCDGLRSRADLAGAIAGGLGLTLGKDNESAALVELGRNPALLIVDNTETPWEGDTLGVEELLGQLAGVAGLALVVTMRGNQRPAGVAWREAFRPKPLPLAAANELFLSLAGRRFAGDARLAFLLSAVDHVPLAITLIAALAEGEPDLECLWERWQQERSAMLKRAGGKDRLTNMELSYELSWSGPRMTPEGRQLLQLLVLLPAGLAHADLEAVLPEADQAAPVLRKAGLAFDEAQRLRVLAPLREYVRRRYPPEAEDLERMVGHYVSLAAQQGSRVGSAQGGAAIIRIGVEAPNVEAMLLRGLEGKLSTSVVRSATDWAEFMRFTGVGSTAPLERAAEIAKRSDDSIGEADCIKRLGDIAVARSDYKGARAQYEKALPLYQKVGSQLGEADCVYSLGKIALERSDHEDARTQYEKALPLYQKVGALLGEANCIKSLGDIALERSDHEGARAQYEKALPLHQKVGDLLGEANCIYSLGDIAFARSDHEGAQAQYEKALPLYQKVGALRGEANCIYSLG